MQSIIAVTNKHNAKLHHVGSLYVLTYDARKLKHKKNHIIPLELFPSTYLERAACFTVSHFEWFQNDDRTKFIVMADHVL